VDKATDFISQNSDFGSFDRFTFIRDYANPIVTNWVAIRKTANVWISNSKVSPFNFDAPTFFEEESFNVNHFLENNTKNPSKELIALGKKLFYDKKLSNNEVMSCATCHITSKGYADGLRFSKYNHEKLLKRNTSTLLNTSYQKVFFGIEEQY